MKPHGDSGEVCKEIAGELREMTQWLAGGTMDPDRFRLAVETLEARKVARFGFRLASDVAFDGTARFTLRFADTEEICTVLQVDPLTGEITEDDS